MVRLVWVVLLLPALGAFAGPVPNADLEGFSGRVRGVVREKGDGFVVFEVARLLDVWKDNEAEKPREIVGRRVRVGPRWVKVENRWRPVPLHVALLARLRPGEEISLELRYSELGRFALLELSAEQRERARKPLETDRPAAERERADRAPLPEGVAGFCGRVRGVVLGPTDGPAVRYRIDRVLRVWKRNEATNIEAMEGLEVLLGPAWVKGEDGRHHRVERHVHFLDKLNEREALTIEVRHAERLHFAILELTAEQRARAERRGGE